MAENFKVVDQPLRTEKNAAGQYVSVRRVTYVTVPSNQPGFVDIPESAYSAEEAARLIGPAAAEIERTQAL